MATAAAVHTTRSSLLPRRNFCQRLAVLSPWSIPSRGKRFLRRQTPYDNNGQSATLADLAALPDWIMLDDEQIHNAASVAALLHFRRQIDRIVDGEQIRQICETFGEECFDTVCEASLPDEAMLADADANLPPLEQICEFGKKLLVRGLPSVMAARFEDARGDPTFFALANSAVEMAATCGRSRQQDGLP